MRTDRHKLGFDLGSVQEDSNQAWPVHHVSTTSVSGPGKLVQQTRTRRLFSFSQLFSFSVVYLITWGSVGWNMYFALYNGGPVAWLFGYIICFSCVVAQTASLSEMASIQPVAGAQYYWTYHLAPRSTRLFLTWMQGWFTWTAYVALLSSVFNGSAIILEATIAMNHPSYEPGGWHTTLLVMAHLGLCTFVNMYTFKLVPWLEFMTGILNISLFFAYVVALFVMAPRNSPSSFLATHVASGWQDNYFISANLGQLANIYLFIGFENVAHMGEETRDPKRAVPKAMFWSVVGNGICGLVMLITLLVCMPDIDIMLSSPSPLITVLAWGTGSVRTATLLSVGMLVLCVSCNMTTLSSVSRLTWAWARDGGLPSYFGFVDGSHRVPLRAVLLTSCIAVALSFLHIGSGTYIALNAIVSLSSLAMYLSYLIILACILHARWSAAGLELGEWNMGRWGVYVNLVAILYTLWMIVFLPFPSTLPVTVSNMNYCGPVLGVVLLASVTLWFVRAKEHWKGPNRAIADLVLRDS